MITKYLLVSALVGGLILFAWGFITHSVLSHQILQVDKAFKDPAAVNKFIREQAPENGMYFTPQGVFTIVAFTPEMADKTENIGANLLRQGLLCVLAAALLAMTLAWARTGSVMSGALLLSLVGLASWVCVSLSKWNWYGFPPELIAVDGLDIVGGWFFSALAIGWLKKKFSA